MSVTQNASRIHQPVLVERCVQLLEPALIPVKHPVLVDATVGLGGHSEQLLESIPNLKIIGIDRDGEARNVAQNRLKDFGERIEFVASTYGRLPQILAAKQLETVDAILADLGVSSLQLDTEQRGFAYSHPQAPLDMRMNQAEGFTAADFLNQASLQEIAEVLRNYGEEKFAWQIAKNIVNARETTPFRTSGQLVSLIKTTIPAPARRHGGNPAKRSFQALRIKVNDELGDLEKFLTAALKALRIGGRLVVESYQSLEDRLVKRAFEPGLHPPVLKGLPVIPAGNEPWLKDLTRGAQKADFAEREANPRSQSVRLRAVEKTRQPIKY